MSAELSGAPNQIDPAGVPSGEAAGGKGLPPFSGKIVGAKKPSADEACSRCGSIEPWGVASWCPSCGFYPSLGTWTVANPNAPAEAPPKHFLLLIPKWAWIAVGGVLAILGVSVLAHFVTETESTERTIWGLTQLGVGMLLFFCAHIWAYVVAVMRSGQIGMFDIVLKPFGVWMVTIEDLPKTRVRFWMGTWSLATAIAAMAIVGGIPYSALFDDWGIRGPEKKDVAVAVLQKSEGEKKGSDSLEESLEDFADKVAIEEDDKKPATKFQSVDCLVIGYVEDAENGAFKELVLASLVANELRYVGTLADGFPEEIREDLNQKLPKMVREKPFVRCRLPARWVEPSIMCRVEFKTWNEHQLLSFAKFGSLLDGVKNSGEGPGGKGERREQTKSTKTGAKKQSEG